MQDEMEMLIGDMQLQTAVYKSLCVSMKLKESIKDSLCYSESIYVHFRLNKCTLQELWIFTCIMT